MTREEILNMEEGKEMDKLIAKNIMNFESESIIDMDDYSKIAVTVGFDNPFKFAPSSDVKSCWAMEETLELYELDYFFPVYLKKVILHEKGKCNEWDLIHAKPLQKCKAALLQFYNCG